MGVPFIIHTLVWWEFPLSLQHVCMCCDSLGMHFPCVLSYLPGSVGHLLLVHHGPMLLHMAVIRKVKIHRGKNTSENSSLKIPVSTINLYATFCRNNSSVYSIFIFCITLLFYAKGLCKGNLIFAFMSLSVYSALFPLETQSPVCGIMVITTATNSDVTNGGFWGIGSRN